MNKFHLSRKGLLGSVALAFSLFFTLGTTAMQAQDGSEFAGGNGTEANPWQIATKQQLAAINNYGGGASVDKYFILTKDLKFTAEDFSTFGDFYNDGKFWILCEYPDKFQGTFDGNNHTISGIRGTLFGCMSGGTIKNLNLSPSTNGSVVAGLVNDASGSVISNCHVTGNITGDGDKGGLVASSGDGGLRIIDSSFKGNVNEGGRSGGLIGVIWGESPVVISNCSVEGEIKGMYAGGICGNDWAHDSNSITIHGCSVIGSLEGLHVGGLIGRHGCYYEYPNVNVNVVDSYFEGDITATEWAGGLIGSLYGACTLMIRESYASGKIVLNNSGIGGVGGLVGYVCTKGGIRESYSTVEIKVHQGDAGVSIGGIGIGGIVGACSGIQNAEFTISNCYSHSEISSSGTESLAVGGIVGSSGNCIVLKSYAMGELTADQTTPSAVNGKHAYIGGIWGWGWDSIYAPEGNISSIQRCVAMNPSLTAPHGDKEDIGRIIGGAGSCTFDDNYALDTMILKVSGKDINVNGKINDKNGQDKSASALAQKSTYTGLDWDFDNIWKMSVNGYPIFIWQEDTPIATAPTIITQPVSQTVNVGSTVTFSVTATGTEPLSYQWYKDSSAISGATKSSYTINSVTTGDAGSYYVIVSNSIGSATSSVATLTVNAPASAPVIVTQPVSQTVDVGQSVRFSVVAIGTEPLNYQWLKNGATIPGATSASYTISSAKMEDAGNYMVIVSNSVGMAVSNPVTLTVKDPAVPPVIIVQPMSQEVLIGESVTFSVVATGTEPLSYQWLFNGNPIPGATSSTYSISQVTEANAGNYSVIVSNVAGTAISSTAVLTVKILPPVIVTHPQTQIIMRGSTATFAVIAEGYGLSYQWTFNGKDIAGANQPVYMIPAAEAVNVGSYAVKVSNKAGSVTSQSAMLWLNNLQMYAGVEVYGPIGAKFTVWYKDDAESGEWKKLTSSTVSASPTVVIDYDSPQNKKRFYKVEIE